MKQTPIHLHIKRFKVEKELENATTAAADNQSTINLIVILLDDRRRLTTIHTIERVGSSKHMMRKPTQIFDLLIEIGSWVRNIDLNFRLYCSFSSPRCRQCLFIRFSVYLFDSLTDWMTDCMSERYISINNCFIAVKEIYMFFTSSGSARVHDIRRLREKNRFHWGL